MSDFGRALRRATVTGNVVTFSYLPYNINVLPYNFTLSANFWSFDFLVILISSLYAAIRFRIKFGSLSSKTRSASTVT
jgi:hypothetical protein